MVKSFRCHLAVLIIGIKFQQLIKASAVNLHSNRGANARANEAYHKGDKEHCLQPERDQGGA
jgi:hypothetical protein